jgi:hypothetical protein
MDFWWGGLSSRDLRLSALLPKALAFFEINDVTGFGEPINQRGSELVVLQERTPFLESQIRGKCG